MSVIESTLPLCRGAECVKSTVSVLGSEVGKGSDAAASVLCERFAVTWEAVEGSFMWSSDTRRRIYSASFKARLSDHRPFLTLSLSGQHGTCSLSGDKI